MSDQNIGPIPTRHCRDLKLALIAINYFDEVFAVPALSRNMWPFSLFVEVWSFACRLQLVFCEASLTLRVIIQLVSYYVANSVVFTAW